MLSLRDLIHRQVLLVNRSRGVTDDLIVFTTPIAQVLLLADPTSFATTGISDSQKILGIRLPSDPSTHLAAIAADFATDYSLGCQTHSPFVLM
jgi:hypothetical protein